MMNDLAKIILFGKAVIDVLKDKFESKACELAIQVKNFSEKTHNPSANGSHTEECNFKEKAKEELFQLITEITHRAQINEIQIKGFIRDKLTELTNNALLDSMELNDIRAEIAGLRAEIADIKSQINLQRQ